MAKAPEVSPVAFGTDEWGTWAKSVEQRLTTLLTPDTSARDKLDAEVAARLDAVEKGVKELGSLPKAKDGEGVDTSATARLARIEQTLGISHGAGSAEQSESDPAKDAEGGGGE